MCCHESGLGGGEVIRISRNRRRACSAALLLTDARDAIRLFRSFSRLYTVPSPPKSRHQYLTSALTPRRAQVKRLVEYVLLLIQWSGHKYRSMERRSRGCRKDTTGADRGVFVVSKSSVCITLWYSVHLRLEPCPCKLPGI